MLGYTAIASGAGPVEQRDRAASPGRRAGQPGQGRQLSPGLRRASTRWSSPSWASKASSIASEMSEQARQAPVEDPQPRGDMVAGDGCSASIRAARRTSLASSRSTSNPWHELAEAVPDRHPRSTARRATPTEFGAASSGSRRGHRWLRLHISDMSWSKTGDPVRGAEEGRGRVEARHQHRRRQPAAVARPEAAADGHLEGVLRRLPCRRTSSRVKVVRLTTSRSWSWLDKNRVSSTSRVRLAAGGEKPGTRGENYQMKIVRLVPEERKIGLSTSASDEHRADWECPTRGHWTARGDAGRSFQAFGVFRDGA